MTDTPSTPHDVKKKLLAAIEPHVPFDGWTETSFRMAVTESGVEPAVAKGVCPRGAVDLAIAFHEAGDAAMIRRIRSEDMSEMRFRDKVAAAVRYRLEAVPDRELVRRGSTLFSLPAYAPDGAKLIWGTADAIWTALGDKSDDVNWYTKRASLAAVYSSTVLYWLGDDSPDHARTWGFLDRRIDGVMQFEKLKAKVRGNALLKPLFAGPNWALSWIKAPTRAPDVDLPGRWSEPE